MAGYRVGVDVGGTFTDFILLDEVSGSFVNAKAPSRPEAPELAIVEGLATLLQREGVAPGALTALINGTTLGLNTIIQRSGARVGLLVTRGFRDLLELRRVRLPGAPSFYVDRPVPLVPRRLVREIDERVLANGRVYRPLDTDEVEREAAELRAAGAEAIAICFLHAYRNPGHEQRAAAVVRAACPELYVCASSEVWPQQREYERSLVTTMNAHIGPRVAGYYARLQDGLRGLGLDCPVLSTKSNGGVMAAEQAAGLPVETLLSGPAAGVIAATQLGRLTGRDRLIAFDMGGTSADISVIDGDFAYSTESQIGDFPLMMPAIDVTSIGAGGGSVAWADAAGVLKVGPRSAGAEPGPACYGRGGQEPTVTDAYVQSGLIAPDEFLGGELRLDPSLAERALAELGQRLGLSATEAAAGILRVATANMYAQFLPLMAQHGVDHRRFSLLAYGGAGPTHAFLLAREVGIGSVIVPPSPGTLCALGCLLADLRADFVRTVYRQLDDAVADDLADDLARLEQQAEAWLVAEGVAPEARSLVRSAEMRYHGQSFEVTVRLNRSGATGLRELPELFHERHRAVYGYAEPGAAVELITMRVQGVGAAPRPARLAPRGQREARQNGPPIPAARRTIVLDGVPVEAGVYRRDELRPGARIDGPAVVIQYDSTTVVPPDFVVEVDEWLNLIGTREGAGDSRGESR